MGSGQPGETPELDKLLREIRSLVTRTSKLLLTSVALVVIGFFGGPIAGNTFFWLLFIVGFILLFVWLARRYGFALPRVLGREELVDQWGILIGNGQGNADNIFQSTERLITDTKAPDIKMESHEMAPSIIRGLLGGRRPFLLVTNNTNSNLKPYRMYINARDYGNNLQISWYVVHQPGFWRKVLALLGFIPLVNLLVLPFYLFGRLTEARQAGLLDLDLFDLQDLTAYVTNAHHCLLEAVEKLMVDLHQDPSKIERKSRGFLGIS